MVTLEVNLTRQKHDMQVVVTAYHILKGCSLCLPVRCSNQIYIYIYIYVQILMGALVAVGPAINSTIISMLYIDLL